MLFGNDLKLLRAVLLEHLMLGYVWRFHQVPGRFKVPSRWFSFGVSSAMFAPPASLLCKRSAQTERLAISARWACPERILPLVWKFPSSSSRTAGLPHSMQHCFSCTLLDHKPLLRKGQMLFSKGTQLSAKPGKAILRFCPKSRALIMNIWEIDLIWSLCSLIIFADIQFRSFSLIYVPDQADALA